MTSHCHTCKFAEWAMTANGRRNPRKPGRCHWTKTVQVARACSAEPLRLKSMSSIWWDDSWICPVYVRKEPQP